MQKIFKKSLALAVSAALCLTAFIGCLSVNAEEPTAKPSYVVESVAGAPGATVKINVKGSNLTDICGQDVDVILGKGLSFVNAFWADDTEMIKIGTEDGGDYNLIQNEDNTNLKFVDIINFVTDNPDHAVETASFDFYIMATIPQDAVAGTVYDVTLMGDFANQDEAWLNENVSITSGKVKVVTDPTYVVTGAEGAPGETVTVSVSGKDLLMVCGQKFDVVLAEGLEFVKAYDAEGDFVQSSTEDGGDYNIINNADGTTTIRFVDIINFPDEITTVDYNFDIDVKIPAGAEDAAEYAVNLTGDFADFGEGDVKVNITNGVITVKKTVTEPVYDATVKIMGKNGLFESDYSLLYYVPVSMPEGWYISVSKAKYSGNTRIEDVVVTLTVEDVYKTVSISGADYYQVALKGIAAKEVANEIVATLHKVVDGIDYYGDALNYNLVSYAEARIAKNQPKEVAAMAAFLNYAAATQNRFNYNTAQLANASLTEEQKVVTPASEITDETRDDNYIVIDNPTATLNGFAPSYEDKMTLVTYCGVPENYIEAGLKIRYEYVSGSISKTEYISLAESKPFQDTYRQVAFTGLAIKDVRTPVLVTVVDSENNAISNTRRYSFEVYAASRQTTSADYEPARAMIAFGDMFKAFKEG